MKEMFGVIMGHLCIVALIVMIIREKDGRGRFIQFLIGIILTAILLPFLLCVMANKLKLW